MRIQPSQLFVIRATSTPAALAIAVPGAPVLGAQLADPDALRVVQPEADVPEYVALQDYAQDLYRGVRS